MFYLLRTLIEDDIYLRRSFMLAQSMYENYKNNKSNKKCMKMMKN